MPFLGQRWTVSPRLVFATVESGFNKSLGALHFQGPRSRKEERSARHCMHDEETPFLKPLTESRIDRSLPTCGKEGEGVTYTSWTIPGCYQTTFQEVFSNPSNDTSMLPPNLATGHSTCPSDRFRHVAEPDLQEGEGSWGYAGSLPSVGKSGSPSTRSIPSLT